MAATSITLCTAALLLVGADEINSFSDSTREAKLCGAIYEDLKDDMLQSHPWRFSIGQVELNQLAAAPLFGFSYGYQLPADYLNLVGKELSNMQHKLYENKIYVNSSTLRVNYQFVPDESKFPAYFKRLIEFELATILSVGLLEDEGKAALYENLANKQMKRARRLDSQSDGKQVLSESKFAFTATRH